MESRNWRGDMTAKCSDHDLRTFSVVYKDDNDGLDQNEEPRLQLLHGADREFWWCI